MERPMSTGPRRPRPAALDWEHRWRLRWQYASFYDQDAEFCEALIELYERHCTVQEPFLERARDVWDVHQATWCDWQPPLPSAEWAHGYLAAIAETANGFGLQRLGRPRPSTHGEFRPSSGELLIHAWCANRAREHLAGRVWPPERFSLGVEAGGARPEVGEVVCRDEIPISGPSGERVVLIDEQRRPLVRIHLEDQWDLRSEPKAAAKERLLAEARRQIDAELERIAVDAEGRGYRFSDTTPKALQHLRWLFEHVALKKSYGQIAEEQLGGRELAPSVYNRIKPYADLIGIALGSDQ
jgi:hypothetical protein